MTILASVISLDDYRAHRPDTDPIPPSPPAVATVTSTDRTAA